MHYVKQFNINGVDTKQVACIELQGVPNAATEGAVGVLGMDMTSLTHDVYRCVAVNGSVYTWELLSAGMSILSSTITGEGGETKVFPYSTLRIPSSYLIKKGDLILDSEGYLYQISTIDSDSCNTTYCGTHIGGIASGDKDYKLTIVDGELRLVTESGNVISKLDYLLPDNDTITRNTSNGVTSVRGIKTINEESLRLFVGTREEYDALTDVQKNNLFAILTDDTTREDIFKLISLTDATNLMRLPLVLDSLDQSGLVTEPCTTEDLVKAMPKNSSIAFTVNTNDPSMHTYITDAPVTNSDGDAFGFCILYKGWTNNYCYGLYYSIYGDLYTYKYHTGVSLDKNGWHKVYTSVDITAPKMISDKKLTEAGYYYIEIENANGAQFPAYIPDGDSGFIGLGYRKSFGVFYWGGLDNGDNRVSVFTTDTVYMYELRCNRYGNLSVYRYPTGSSVGSTDMTKGINFYVKKM